MSQTSSFQTSNDTTNTEYIMYNDNNKIKEKKSEAKNKEREENSIQMLSTQTTATRIMIHLENT